MATLNIIMAGLFLLIILYLVIQVFAKPIKLLWKLLFNTAVGFILLIIVNYIGGFFDFAVPINLITILIVGFLGTPGLLLIICFKLLMM